RHLRRPMAIVSKPPFSLGTTASAGTGGPATPGRGPPWKKWPRPANGADGAFTVACGEEAELPAIPAAAPTSAQAVPIAPVRMSVDLFMWRILLGPGGRC